MAERANGFQAPRQERSRRTLGRIVEATEWLLLERGPDGLTVKDVVARAETSVGAFYTRFGSKDDAVVYVQARFWDEVRGQWADFLAPERWEGVGAGPIVAEVIRRFCRLFLSGEVRARALLNELVVRRDEKLLARIRELDAEIARMMGRLLESRWDELGHPRPGEAVEVGFRRVISAVRDQVLIGSAAPTGAERVQSEAEAERDLVLSLVQMYGSFLRTGSEPGDYGALLSQCAVVHRTRGAARR